MPQLHDEGQFVYSTLASDPDLAELVEMFVDEMPERIQTLIDYAEGRNWQELTRTAHQLKGSAGSYGFHQITPLARELEAASRDADDEAQILQSLEELVAMCRQMRAGCPGFA